MWYRLTEAEPEDRFMILYEDIGPDLDTLKEICELFDIHVLGYNIMYEINGVQYIAEGIDDECTDEERIHRIYARLMNQMDEQRVDRLYGKLSDHHDNMD